MGLETEKLDKSFQFLLEEAPGASLVLWELDSFLAHIRGGYTADH